MVEALEPGSCGREERAEPAELVAALQQRHVDVPAAAEPVRGGQPADTAADHHDPRRTAITGPERRGRRAGRGPAASRYCTIVRRSRACSGPACGRSAGPAAPRRHRAAVPQLEQQLDHAGEAAFLDQPLAPVPRGTGEQADPVGRKPLVKSWTPASGAGAGTAPRRCATAAGGTPGGGVVAAGNEPGADHDVRAGGDLALQHRDERRVVRVVGVHHDDDVVVAGVGQRGPQPRLDGLARGRGSPGGDTAGRRAPCTPGGAISAVPSVDPSSTTQAVMPRSGGAAIARAGAATAAATRPRCRRGARVGGQPQAGDGDGAGARGRERGVGIGAAARPSIDETSRGWTQMTERHPVTLGENPR